MSDNFFPRAEDFDEMGDHLETIAKILADKVEIDINDWAGVQKAVRMGLAPEFFPVGTQLVVNHSVYGDIVLDVVAHDHYEAADIKGAHTMTLMSHDIFEQMAFNESEAFYYADEELPAGTYNFTLAEKNITWEKGTYQFTLPYSLPAGGQLCIHNPRATSLTSTLVTAFISASYDFSSQSAEITMGSDGTNLGTFGVELNHIDRVRYGSNNYKESNIRQFLNSSATMGYVWFPKTKFSRPPYWMISLDGFVNGLDTDLLGVIGRVNVPCVTNGVYESPDSELLVGQKYNLVDRFYLPSAREMGMDPYNDTDDGSVLLPYFLSSSDSERVKYLEGLGVAYWTRSPLGKSSNSIRNVSDTGSGYSSTAAYAPLYGFAPMFNIV